MTARLIETLLMCAGRIDRLNRSTAGDAAIEVGIATGERVMNCTPSNPEVVRRPVDNSEAGIKVRDLTVEEEGSWQPKEVVDEQTNNEQATGL